VHILLKHAVTEHLQVCNPVWLMDWCFKK